MPRPGELDLARLRFKYETILALRLRGNEEAPPVRALRALALEFPGALRTLDMLTLAHVHDRIDEIVSAELDPGHAAPWMLAELTFAHAMRGVKAVKAWLRGRKDVDAETRAKFAREVADIYDSAFAITWKDDLARIAQPPRGRLVPLALARVAAVLGVSEEDAASLIFRDDGRARVLSDQDFLGAEEPPPDVPLLPPPPPLVPLAPPPLAPPLPPAGAGPEPLPPPPSDFLLELSPLDEPLAPAPPAEPDESEEAPPVAGAAEPPGLDDE